MDKIIIHHNNKVKFEKNKTSDKQLRRLDYKLFKINKTIKKNLQNIFMQNREIKDINEYYKKNPYKIFRYLKKIKILALKSLVQIPYLKFKYYQKKNLENKIAKLI